ncbi:Retinoic acid induced 16-like protein-domain-containing protein [Chaetomidium leptoderma]|uniref:Retinoic acid induced 16-like protein-domain-containing protein n=1 Tax=Chaetomidium leptoderma TaxID=669021 RepID=A0AAN6ZZA7_9PEZI|nr:Retinoic acid induced 16-like protein-domain-containing protein [Chaetomidium leptoderma]
MDFWSRLLAHTPLSSASSRKDFAKDPARRLHRFEKEYSQLLHTWRNSSNLAHDDDAAEHIEIRLQELTNLLSDESRRPLPHPCIAFAAAKQVYIPVAKIATSSSNEWIIKEAVLFFASLVESEEEAFVENETFAASLTNLLVRITGANSIRLGADTEARVVELAFNITTKIRLEPEILAAWFKSHQQNGPSDARLVDHREKFAGRTQKQDFPLFYLLMDYIHHEGKVGDFARTGLLYIIEAASSSVLLEQWIVESDLSTLMATGLGALYSQLSRKLVIDHPPNELPPILAFSDYQHPKSNYDVVSSCSFQFQSHLDTFLSHLLFWQDVLNHCRSVEVKSTLLEHFQVIFLQQLLYPSLLESSDVDGGSSVAVLTYLRRILESLDHPDMVNLILHYLLGLPDIVGSVSTNSGDVVSAARKRKSLDLATMMASKGEAAADPLLFNLVDLILACLRSQNNQTVYVTLQLVSVILKRHHRYAVITLLYTEGVLGESYHRTSGAHQQEVDYLMSLAGSAGGQDNFDEIYDNILKDTLVRLENHPCSIKLVTPKTSTHNHKLPAVPDTLPGAPRDVRSHTLHPSDPLLNIVLDRLETFFLNSVDTNLALTEAIFDLAVCGFMHLEGWFMRSPLNYVYEEEDDSPPLPEPPLDPESQEYIEYKQMQSMQESRRRPRWSQSGLPRLLKILQVLCDQVAAYRETVPRFDDLLQQRREAFQIADCASQPLPLHPARTSQSSVAIAGTPTTERMPGFSDDGRNTSRERPSGLEGFAQRILSELGTPTRSGSPRGRKDVANRSTPIPFPSSSSDAPLRPPPQNTRSFSPGTTSPSSSSWDGRPDAFASQAKAFQAVDQSILARRVGIPDVVGMKPAAAAGGGGGGGLEKSVEPIALSFDRQRTAGGVSSADEKLAADREEAKAEEGGGEDALLAPSEDGEQTEDDDVADGEDEPGTPTLGRRAGADHNNNNNKKTVSVSHVLTNVIVLQAFLFELASVVQVRAGLFDEVRFA